MTEREAIEILGRPFSMQEAPKEILDAHRLAISALEKQERDRWHSVAKEGNPESIAFPRAKVNDGIYDFSFSGLKSAVLNYLNGCKMKGEEINEADVAASFQKAVTEVLVDHAIMAVKESGMDKHCIRYLDDCGSPYRNMVQNQKFEALKKENKEEQEKKFIEIL